MHNLAKNRKSVDCGKLDIRSHVERMVGADESSEQEQPNVFYFDSLILPLQQTFAQSMLLIDFPTGILHYFCNSYALFASKFLRQVERWLS